MQGSVALEPLEPRYSRGLKELIYSLLQRNPDDRPDVHLAMANPFVVNALMNLCTDIGRLPCTRYVCVFKKKSLSPSRQTLFQAGEREGGVWNGV